MGECFNVTLSELMADPLVRMVMAADGIDPQEFELNLRNVGEHRRNRDAVGDMTDIAPARRS